MTRRRLRSSQLMLLGPAVGLVLAGTASSGSDRWGVTELATPGRSSNALAINGRGQIVGIAEARDGHRAVLWQRGRVVELGTLSSAAGAESLARELSDSGEVVGWSTKARDGPMHAFLWRNGTMSELAPPGVDESQATGINERGGVIGVTRRRGRDRAFYWRNGGWTSIESLSPFANPPLAINDRGQVMGWWKERHSWRGHFRRWNWRTYLWQSGRLFDLGTLGGEYTRARAMNERGQVVGESETPTELADHAFLWEKGRLRDLGTLGGRQSGATAINDSGVIVGWSQTRDGEWHGFRWRRGRIEDLGPECFPAFITNRGLIVGTDQSEDRPCVIANREVSWLPGRYEDIDLYAVNEKGQIVGTALRTFSSPSRAVVWERKR